MSIENYYAIHPNATLKEYFDYIKEENKIKKQQVIEKEHKLIEWYKNLEGRYFILNFNNDSFLAVYVDKWPNNAYNNPYLCYNIVLDTNCINEQEKRQVSRYWFKNPYEDNYFGQNEGSCKEITKEEFDSIVDKYKTIKNLIGTINLK